MAAGAWSGEFLSQQLGGSEMWATAVRPRKGLLLEMPRPDGMPEISRGLMEMGYTKVLRSSLLAELARYTQ